MGEIDAKTLFLETFGDWGHAKNCQNICSLIPEGCGTVSLNFRVIIW